MVICPLPAESVFPESYVGALGDMYTGIDVLAVDSEFPTEFFAMTYMVYVPATDTLLPKEYCVVPEVSVFPVSV
jgi:hypothetical protein